VEIELEEIIEFPSEWKRIESRKPRFVGCILIEKGKWMGSSVRYVEKSACESYVTNDALIGRIQDDSSGIDGRTSSVIKDSGYKFWLTIIMFFFKEEKGAALSLGEVTGLAHDPSHQHLHFVCFY